MSPRARTDAPLVGDAELRQALEQTLNGHVGRRRQIAALDRRASPYGSSFALEELDVHLSDGTRLELMFKNVSPTALLERARGAKPAFLYHPMREIETYRTILARESLGTPTFHGAVVEPHLGRYWLFIEKAPGAPLWQVGDFDVWRRVARWLAELHARMEDHASVRANAQAAHVLRYDGDFYRGWLDRAQAVAKQRSHAAGRKAGRDLARLLERYERIVDRLLELPTTFIHGELYASNIMVQEADPVRVCPVDWEMAAIGPGLIDLAALTSGQWSEEERRDLALAYASALPTGTGGRVEQDDFLNDLDCCRLHLAVQWLGWSADWTPPPEHTQDWLTEGMRAADTVRV